MCEKRGWDLWGLINKVWINDKTNKEYVNEIE